MGTPSERRLAVRVTADAMRHVRAGHPWIYADSVTSVSAGGAAGDLAVVFDDRRRFAAIGLYDPGSPIAVRVLHRGSPRTIDRSFWRERFDAAIAVRGALAGSATTTGWRVVHGENDGLAGLVVDRYDTTLVVKLYSAAWFAHLADVTDELGAALAAAGVTVERIVLRLARNVAGSAPAGRADGDLLLGTPPDGPVLFSEHGMTFEADVVSGQKTGHFLDQRDNRARVGELAGRRRVLDVFCCTGGFSVHAAAGGASQVLGVDLAPASLAVAERNMERNRGIGGAAACDYTTRVGDAFEVMAELDAQDERFGLVVVDPPSFAHRRTDLDRALRAYRRLADLGLRLVDDRGTYVQSSCSSLVDPDTLRRIVLDAADASGRAWDLREQTHQPVDHPIGFPQGEYLSSVYVRMDPPGSRTRG